MDRNDKKNIDFQKEIKSQDANEQNLLIEGHKRNRKQQQFKESIYTKIYNKQFFDVKKQTGANRNLFDLKQYENRFKMYNVTYKPQRPIPVQFNLRKSRQQMRGKIKIYTVRFSYFSVDVSIYNEVNDNKFDSTLLYQDFITSGSFGSICAYEADKDSTPSSFVIKLLKFNQTPWQVIHSAIKEYAFMKFFAALKIGPEIKSPFGFDIVTTSNYVFFSMEKGIIMEDFIQKIQGKQNKIKNYVKVLQESLKVFHYLSIVHNDIKPQNIIYSPIFQKLVFIDFGLSEALQFPIGTQKLVGFRGSFLYCSAEMKKLFSQGGNGFIDLYYNDFECWKNTKEWIQSNQNFRHFSLSYQLSVSLSNSLNYQSHLGYYESQKKNTKVKSYFQKIKILYAVHSSTRQKFRQWFMQNQSYKEIIWHEDDFFVELAQTYNLKGQVNRSPIIDSNFMSQSALKKISQSIETKKINSNKISSSSIQQIQTIIKHRYNDQNFEDKQKFDEILKYLNPNEKILTENNKQIDQTQNLKRSMHMNRLKQIVLKTIINQFDFLKGLSKDVTQMHRYLYETMRLVLQEEEQQYIARLSIEELVNFCLNYSVKEILKFLQYFSVRRLVYHFITEQLVSTQKLKNFALKYVQSQDQNYPNSSDNILQTNRLSFFYYQLEKYIVFLINRFQAQKIFEEGYQVMEKVKLSFYTKLNDLRNIWQQLDSQFTLQNSEVKQYLSSQIIKTYLKQLMLRCSYFYCKLGSQMFFFAHEKNNLPKMFDMLKQINFFFIKSQNDILMENMIRQQPISVQYKEIMKIMYVMYFLPDRSYRKIFIKQKIQKRIINLTTKNNEIKRKKDQYRHIVFLLTTLYIRILSSQNLYTQLFQTLQSCFQIVRYWRCQYLFLNVITIMIQFNNDEIILRARKYLQNLKNNAFSSISYMSTDYFTHQNNQNQGQKIGKMETSYQSYWEEHFRQMSKICIFKKISQKTSEAINFISNKLDDSKNFKIERSWIKQFNDCLNMVEQKSILSIRMFSSQIENNRDSGQNIVIGFDIVKDIQKDISYQKQMCQIQIVLSYYFCFQIDIVCQMFNKLLLNEKVLNDKISQIGMENLSVEDSSKGLDIMFLNLLFLIKVNQDQNSILTAKLFIEKDKYQTSITYFLQLFQHLCFDHHENNLTYVQTYISIVNSQIKRLKQNHHYQNFIQPKISLKNDLIKKQYKKLYNLFKYMSPNNKSKTKENYLQDQSANSSLKILQQKNKVFRDYISFIFTLKQQFIEMAVNVCDYFVSLMEEEIESCLKLDFKQIKEFLSEKIELQALRITFRRLIRQMFAFFQKLTLFTTKYCCKNYSQFIFRTTSRFMLSYLDMTKKITQKPYNFINPDNKQIYTNFLSVILQEISQQILENIDFIINPFKWRLKNTIMNKNEISSQTQVSNGEFQTQINNYFQNGRENKQIILVCFLLLKITIKDFPKQSQMLIQHIISRQIINLYKYSVKIIRQNVETYILMISKAMLLGIKSNLKEDSMKDHDVIRIQRKIAVKQIKINKKQRIKKLLQKRGQIEKIKLLFPDYHNYQILY